MGVGRLESYFCKPAHGRSIVNRSTSWGRAPSRTYVLTVFNNTRNSGIAIRIREHLCTPGAIILGVVLNKLNALGIVKVSRLLAVRTAWLNINN